MSVVSVTNMRCAQCTLCLLTMIADISWDQLQAGKNCKICLKTCCLLLNTVSLFSSPIEYLLFCLFFCLQLMIVPMDTGQLLLFYICIFSFTQNTTVYHHDKICLETRHKSSTYLPASTFSLFSVQATRGVYVLFAPSQCHHHRRLQKRENNDITILAKITKGTKKNQDILTINFSRLVEVISVDIFCMKCPKAKHSKIKFIDLRGRPRSRVSAEGSAQLFGVC